MISVKDLTKTYSPGTRAAEEVLHGVSFELPETGFVCILGRSGSGKTSLLNAIGGLDAFDSGTVEIDGTRVGRSDRSEIEKLRNINFGYVFQNYYLLPEHSVAYNVYLGLHSLDLDERQKLKRVQDALEKVDMLRFRKRLVGELSGGQQQRVAIARAIAKSPRVIFADEPTGNLDEESTLSVCTTLKNISRNSLVVMVTHEERLADFFADRIIRIEDGNIVSDSSEWERGVLDSAEKDSVYSADYKDETFSSGDLSIRVLSADGSDPADITLVVEDGRLIIKTDDKRLVMYSKESDPPYIKEGSRPKLELRQTETEASGEDETERPPQKQANRSGLGLRMLLAEMRTTASKKRLRNFANALFIMLLSLMMLLSITDIAASAKVDPKEFISADSHVIELQFSKGKNYNDRTSFSVSRYVPQFLDALDAAGLEYDVIPDTNMEFRFYTNILPQYEGLSMSFGRYNLVDLERLDPSQLVYGRMPERYDEIVVDRWVIQNCTDRDGIVQNLIPDSEYMIGKQIYMENREYYPTIVGICDSGEPSIYISKAGMLSVGIHGIDAIPYSEFVTITGMTGLAPVKPGECVVIADNAGSYYMDRLRTTVSFTNLRDFYLREAVSGAGYGRNGITAPIVISDEEVEELLRYAVETSTHFDMWCADKDAVKKTIAESLPEELQDVLLIDVKDTYETEYSSYMQKRSVRLQTRFVITAAVGILCLVMLYIIQRFRVGDRIDMIAVYRMLGIPGRDSVGVFVLESIMLTLRYAVPTVFIAWAVVTVLPLMGMDWLEISIPLWVPFLTVAAIVAADVIVAVLAVIRLIGMPPAQLASKTDF